MKDYYKILGVEESASTDDIKKAFRKLAREYHPDKTGGDKNKEKIFMEINEAYEILGNEENRKNYHNKGKNNKNNPTQSNEKNYAKGFDMNDFEKHFESFFGFSKEGEKVNKNSQKINTDNMFNSFFNIKK
jgi:DnaJ-class molecular chaperone